MHVWDHVMSMFVAIFNGITVSWGQLLCWFYSTFDQVVLSVPTRRVHLVMLTWWYLGMLECNITQALDSMRYCYMAPDLILSKNC